MNVMTYVVAAVGGVGGTMIANSFGLSFWPGAIFGALIGAACGLTYQYYYERSK